MAYGFKEYDMDEKSALHERVNLLKNEGYRGFSVMKDVAKWNRREVTVKNSSGTQLKATGDTREEAYKKAVDMIDYNLDDLV